MIIPLPITGINILGSFLSFSHKFPKITKQVPPATPIDQWVKPRHKISIAEYPKAPNINKKGLHIIVLREKSFFKSITEYIIRRKRKNIIMGKNDYYIRQVCLTNIIFESIYLILLSLKAKTIKKQSKFRFRLTKNNKIDIL